MRALRLFLLLPVLIYLGCRPQQKAGNDVRVHLSQDPGSLNPVSYSSKDAIQLINLLYQSLLTVDLADGKIKPLLAEKLPIVERRDSVTLFSYRIRPEATWQNGSSVTASDVAFTLKLLKSPLLDNEKRLPDYEFIRDIETYGEDPKKFTLVCDGYTPEQLLLTGDFFILPEYLTDPENLLRAFTLPQLTSQFDSFTNNPKLRKFAGSFNSDKFTRNKDFLQGSAGYLLQDWTTGQAIVLKKKTNWWGNNLKNPVPHITANPEQLSFLIIPDNTAALQALKNKRLDVWQNIPSPVFRQLRKDKAVSAAYRFFTPLTYSFVYIGLNGNLPALSGKNTRLALAHLLDYDILVNVTQENLAKKTIGPVSPADKQNYNTQIKPYGYNPDKAKALLKADGWQKNSTGWVKKLNGENLTLNLKLNYKAGSSEFETIGLILQEAAAKIGIPVTLQPLESQALSKNLRQGDYEMVVRTLSGSPFVFNFKPVLHTESVGNGGMNITAFGTAESDSLIDALYITEDPARKTILLKRFQEILHEQGNLIFLYFLQDRLAISRRFTNLKVSGIKPGYDVSAFKTTEE